jgi:putative flippase GtrA
MVELIKLFILYAKNGVIVNLIGYFFFILMTTFSFDPITTISITYPFGIMLSFFFHNRYTFNKVHTNRLLSILKYLFVYFIGYLINLIILIIFHNKLLFPHEVVQIFSIVVISLVLFTLNRKFVFKQ